MSGQPVQPPVRDRRRDLASSQASPTTTGSNGTEQTRTTMTVHHLPNLTKPDHLDRTISRKTLGLPAGPREEFFSPDHRSSTETAPCPNTNVSEHQRVRTPTCPNTNAPINSAGQNRTNPNKTEQARTPTTVESLPELINFDHTDRTISSKTLAIRASASEVFFRNILARRRKPRSPEPLA